MSKRKALQVSAQPLSPPVIDLTQPQAVTVSAIKAACVTHGFFVIVNHNMDVELIEEARRQAVAFFRLPNDVKKTCALKTKGERFLHGYVEIGAEASDVANLSLTGKKVAPKDLMESFQIGDPHFVKNTFPKSSQYKKKFQATLERAYAALRSQGQQLITLVAAAIGAPAGFLESKHDATGRAEHRSVLRVTRYPALASFGLRHAAGAPQLRIGPHRDLGSLTLLCQDDQGGLQVQLDEDGTWHDVAPVANSIVVNLGNLFQRYYNRVFRSSIHRVVSNASSNTNDRYSVILFINPNDDAAVQPMAHLLRGKNKTKPQYEKIVTGAYMDCKFTQLFDENAKEFKGKCIYDD